MKACTKCGSTENGFYLEHGKPVAICKICACAKTKAWTDANIERARFRTQEWRKANAARVKAYRRALYAATAESAIASALEWQRQNHELVQIKNKRWRDANPEKVRAAARKWSAANADRLLAMQRTRRAAHPEREAANAAKRRTRILKAAGSHTAYDIKVLHELQRERCACCGLSLKVTGSHVDHIVSLANGGSNDRYNLQLLCPTCNTSKSAKDPIAFMQQNGFLL